MVPEDEGPATRMIVESGNIMPKRIQQELHALDCDQDHNNAPPAHSTRSRTRTTSLALGIQHSQSTLHCGRIGKLLCDPQKSVAWQIPLQVFAEMAKAVLDRETGNLLEYRHLLKSPKYQQDWNTSPANEFGRLAQGIGGCIEDPTNTIFFINKSQVPKKGLGT